MISSNRNAYVFTMQKYSIVQFSIKTFSPIYKHMSAKQREKAVAVAASTIERIVKHYKKKKE